MGSFGHGICRSRHFGADFLVGSGYDSDFCRVPWLASIDWLYAPARRLHRVLETHRLANERRRFEHRRHGAAIPASRFPRADAPGYVRTARAKGLSERLVLWKHVLRNSLMTTVTVVVL